MERSADYECIAKSFCNTLWESYCDKYSHYLGRVNPLLFYIATYQHIANYYPISYGDAWKLQQSLLASFIKNYPGIESARQIDWIDLKFEVVELIQAKTGDYRFSEQALENSIDVHDEHKNWNQNINEQLFQFFPTTKSNILETNLNLELIRKIKIKLSEFWLPLKYDAVLGEQELFDLFVHDIAQLLIGSLNSPPQTKKLDVYLYIFQSAVLGNQKTKEECAQLAYEMQIMVNNTQGDELRPIDKIWQIGLGYSDKLVRDYNTLISLLDNKVCSVVREDLQDRIKVSIWSYPSKAQTLQVVVLNDEGDYSVTSSGKSTRFTNIEKVAMSIVNTLLKTNKA